MPDYRYYVETYLGEDIPEADFPRLIRRAQAELARMRDVYAVQSRPAWTPQRPTPWRCAPSLTR